MWIFWAKIFGKFLTQAPGYFDRKYPATDFDVHVDLLGEKIREAPETGSGTFWPKISSIVLKQSPGYFRVTYPRADFGILVDILGENIREAPETSSGIF